VILITWRTFWQDGASFSVHLARMPSPVIVTALLTSAPRADARARRKARVRAAKAGTGEDSRMIEDSP
jgi:hypothetical protein